MRILSTDFSTTDKDLFWCIRAAPFSAPWCIQHCVFVHYPDNNSGIRPRNSVSHCSGLLLQFLLTFLISSPPSFENGSRTCIACVRKCISTNVVYISLFLWIESWRINEVMISGDEKVIRITTQEYMQEKIENTKYSKSISSCVYSGLCDMRRGVIPEKSR